ncbi:DUF6223 family protein [Nocardioides sp. SYSU DS0651]|uniref:DUF6223 family protein n=1 Tax=Nocardioides sp. SYSU DS0651 TaxID=3415955 RepID=UPI003F4C36CC
MDITTVAPFAVAAASGGYELTTGRIGSVAAALAALTGLGIGVWAVTRASRGPALASVALGLIGVLGGGLVIAASDGGPGTGGGVVGGAVAVASGLASMMVGGWAVRRSRE